MLLYPIADDGPAPAVEALSCDPKQDDIGFRVRRGDDEDVIVMAPAPGLRRIGSKEEGCVTDGETAFVRRVGGPVSEAGLVAGHRLEAGGKVLIDAGPAISCVSVRYKRAIVEVSAHGRGPVQVATDSASRALVNGELATATIAEGRFQLHLGKPGGVTLSKLDFSTTAEARCKGIGVPLGYGGSYRGPDRSALVRFTSSVPTDMQLEWRRADEATWKQVVNPEPLTEHYYLLTDLEHTRKYRLRLTCRDAAGRVGILEEDYTYRDPA